MNQSDNKDHRTMIEKAAGSLMLLCFGLGSLAFLVAIDRAEWFEVRPASGTAMAMARASDRYAGNDMEAANAQAAGVMRPTQGAASGVN